MGCLLFLRANQQHFKFLKFENNSFTNLFSQFVPTGFLIFYCFRNLYFNVKSNYHIQILHFIYTIYIYIYILYIPKLNKFSFCFLNREYALFVRSFIFRDQIEIFCNLCAFNFDFLIKNIILIYCLKFVPCVHAILFRHWLVNKKDGRYDLIPSGILHLKDK